jgi:ABC-2 type transport system permease protein
MHNTIKLIGNYIALTWRMFTINLLAQMSYATSFILQVGGMIISDILLATLWFIFFSRFPILGTWTINDQLLMFSVVWCAHGLLQLFLNGVWFISRYIVEGRFDYYLVLPRNVLWHVAVEQSDVSELGTIIVALWLFIKSGYATSFATISLYGLCVLLCLALFFGFFVLTQSLAFYLGNFERAARLFGWMLFDSIYYPQNIFHGFLAILLKTVFPAYIFGALPVAIIAQGQLSQLWILLLISTTFCITAVIVFYKGLKKYESGGLMGTRV